MWTRLSNREWTPGCWVQGCGVHTGDWKSMAGLPASHFLHRLMLNGTIRPRMCNNIAPSPASFCNQMFDQINTNWNFFRRPTLSDNDPIKVIDFLPLQLSQKGDHSPCEHFPRNCFDLPIYVTLRVFYWLSRVTILLLCGRTQTHNRDVGKMPWSQMIKCVLYKHV